MGKIKLLLKTAAVAGPTVARALHRYGPRLKRLARENSLFRAPAGVSSCAEKERACGSVNTDIARRLEILARQAAVLDCGSHGTREKQQIRLWRGELAQIEKSLPVLEAMSPKLKKSELKKIQSRIDRLSGEILCATLDGSAAGPLCPEKENRQGENGENTASDLP